MDAKLAPSDRLDQLDAERFRDMLASPSFMLLTARIKGELERARTDCARQREVIEVRRAQGAAAALQVVLALPETILREIESRRKP